MKDAHYQTIYDTEVSHWLYRVRRKIVHDLIWKYFPHVRDLKILDIGCGACLLAKELEVYGEVSGLDVSPMAIEFCRERGVLQVVHGSAERIPFGDRSFDLILALDVIEHIEDDRRALQEIYRVLKPGGVAIIFAPAFNLLWGVSDELSNHYRRYTIKELRKKIRESGFEIARLSYFNFFLFVPIALVRLAARLFRLSIESENTIGSALINSMLYKIFNLESKMLKYINVPFGVSILAVCRKPHYNNTAQDD